MKRISDVTDCTESMKACLFCEYFIKVKDGFHGAKNYYCVKDDVKIPKRVTMPQAH